jgi:MFS transporter, FHS family, L-fucose permease
MEKPINPKENKSKSYWQAIIIIGFLFFIFGFVTWLNGALMPFLQTACEITPFEASLVTLAFYIAYFFMALPSSFVLKRTGYKNGLFIGLIVMALGALIFIPAAYTRIYGIFLSGLFVLATGLALLQTAVNPFITIIGPPESAASRISIMGICNKLAGFISPLVLAGLVMHGMDKFKEDNLKMLSVGDKETLLNELASRLIVPYIIMAILLVIFAILIKFSPLPDKVEVDEDENESIMDFIKQIPSALKIPHVLLGVITLFLYVGVEVMAGDSLTQFGKNLKLDYAPKLTSFTMAFMVIGYILGIVLIPKFISQSKALVASAALGILFAIGASTSSVYDSNLFASCFGWINSLLNVNIPLIPNSVFFVTLLGLANALMWPAIWPLVITDLGKFTKIVSALLIMAIVGGALIPPFYAKLGQSSIGFQHSLWIMVPIYIFILYFALAGHKVGKRKS